MKVQSISNSTPMVVLNGINDQSIVQQVTELELIPIHCPLFYLQTPTGPEKPTLAMNGAELARLYGDEAVDSHGVYYNHATALALSILDQGNPIYVKRVTRSSAVGVTPALAPAKAYMHLVAIVDNTAPIKPYERNADGSIVLDPVTGALTVDTTAAAITGGAVIRFKWVTDRSLIKTHADTAAVAQNLNAVCKIANTFHAAGDGVPLFLDAYPLLSVKATFEGKGGNEYGLKIWHASANTPEPGDQDAIADQEALIYGAQIVQRKPNSLPTIVFDNYGESIVKFSFKPSAYDYKTNKKLTIEGLVDNWTNDGSLTGRSPTYSPLNYVTMYYANYTALADIFMTVENDARTAANVAYPCEVPLITSKYMIDFFTGKDYNGIHYFGFRSSGSVDAAARDIAFYLANGSDGDLTDATFETAVIYEVINNHDNTSYSLLDSAKYPFSCIYDSGFANDTKKVLLNWMDYRKDIHVTLGTHVVTPGSTVGWPLQGQADISAGDALTQAALMHSESEVWGTSAVRCVVMMQSGELINGRFAKPVSTVFELAIKRAKYAGSPTGELRPGFAYNTSPNNQLQYMKNLTDSYLTRDSKANAWNAQLNYAQSFDRKTYFFPGLQTVYGSDNSVLSGELFMQICCDVQKQSEIVWKLMTGDDTLTEAQLVERSNDILAKLVAGKYDNRVRIVPNTYFTAADSARGYSWTQEVAIYGQVAKTVSQVTVVTKRNVPAATVV